MMVQYLDCRQLKRKMPSVAMCRPHVPFQAVQPFKTSEIHFIWKLLGSASIKPKAWVAKGHEKPLLQEGFHFGSASLAVSLEVRRCTVCDTGLTLSAGGQPRTLSYSAVYQMLSTEHTATWIHLTLYCWHRPSVPLWVSL